MRAGGRVRCASAGRGFAPLLCLAAVLHAALAAEYGVPIEIKVWDTGRTPLAHMVDVTNSFGLKVLAEHNFLNDNNIAFSPYGLMGILVSLYEGIDGESSYQMQRAISLPWHRNVMRIGFRDIHRTLKTYFVPEEGFLAGLALNNENVTFTDGYKKILRFYGFDLDTNDQLPTLAPTNGTNTTTATDTATPTTTTAMDTGSTQAREDPTTNPNAETINDLDIRGQSTTASPSSAPNAEGTTITSTETTTETTTQSSAVTETTTAVMTTPTPTTVAEETTPSSTVTTQADTETVPASSSTALSDEPTANNEVEETTPMSSTTVTTETTTVTSAVTEMSTQSTETIATASMTETQTETVSTITDATPTAGTDSSLETLQRRKRSIVDFIFTNPPYVDDYLYHRSYDIPIDPDPANPNIGNKMFLVNGLRNVQVSYMVYDTILEHAYLPHLEASALRLPLDSDRYYLLVVLPTRMGALELGRLLARMARESDLSDVCAALRPRRVRAVVPSFTVKGHVTLTTDLQKLGIRDVFEPRQRDFSPMTTQSGVYVRSIEQAVSVAIRKYRATDTNNSSKYVSNRYPVSFSATYPFLYFVMDASIHVSLMAGKMVDPLNSRIL